MPCSLLIVFFLRLYNRQYSLFNPLVTLIMLFLLMFVKYTFSMSTTVSTYSWCNPTHLLCCIDKQIYATNSTCTYVPLVWVGLPRRFTAASYFFFVIYL